MSAAVEAELRLKFVDKGTANGIDKVAKHVEKITQQTESLVTQSNSRQRTSHERLSMARETLGMRSEQRIQREIQQTEGAYKRLAASGKLSQDELTRAAEKTRAKITSLNNEMGKLTKEQQAAAKAAKDFEAAQSRVRTGVAVGAGVVAAGYALRAPVTNALTWQEKIAYMGNTAFPERDARGYQAGVKELEDVINRAVDLKKGGGGTREQAADALSTLLGRNDMGYQEALNFLPVVMRTAYGANADANEIAALSSTLFAQKTVKDIGELKRALNMITAAGQAGGFEIKDMARYLPEQLAVGKGAGYSGLSGLAKILTFNEAVLPVSGTPEATARNVINMLTKFTSKDTAKEFEKAGHGDMGVYLLSAIKKGATPDEAWLKLIERESARDPELKKAIQEIKTSKSKFDKVAAMESAANLVRGSAIGEYFQDIQARTGVFGLFNKDTVDRTADATRRNNAEYGVNDINYARVAGTGAAALRNAEQEAAIRQKEAMDRLIPTISKAADIFVDLSQKYPDLSAAVVAATPPIIALGTAAGVSALALGGQSGGAIGRYAMRAAGWGAAGLGIGAAGGVGYALGDNLLRPGIDKLVQWGSGRRDATLGTAIYDYLNKPATSGAAPESKVHLTIESTTPGFMVKQKSKSDSVNVTTKGNTGNLFSGAP
ncbi:phage tail tape measure protein [Methylomonas sp. MV1]|uniref:phage tail tape measure protein n=1 Tax=Methylomonas sp. MV1 TaxID=3073620 RepID=UPI0028A45576|nr:phage tail tape measure protein [Methylomonas sp. MV1]MDT4329759.1 phage tail tape measure protein [Methylomonas sp. MV1]